VAFDGDPTLGCGCPVGKVAPGDVASVVFCFFILLLGLFGTGYTPPDPKNGKIQKMSV